MAKFYCFAVHLETWITYLYQRMNVFHIGFGHFDSVTIPIYLCKNTHLLYLNEYYCKTVEFMDADQRTYAFYNRACALHACSRPLAPSRSLVNDAPPPSRSFGYARPPTHATAVSRLARFRGWTWWSENFEMVLHKCTFCGSICSTETTLKTYMKRSHGIGESREREYKCSQCDASAFLTFFCCHPQWNPHLKPCSLINWNGISNANTIYINCFQPIMKILSAALNSQ